MLAAALGFSAQDARLAYETAGELVEKCTPRDAGTVACHVVAANQILNAVRTACAEVRQGRRPVLAVDLFKASTPKGMRDFTNLYAEFNAGEPSDKWVVLVSHYDTKSGCGCPGANDGASTSGLLVALAGAFAKWTTPRGNLMLIWTDGEECMEAYGANDGLWGSKRAAQMMVEKKLSVQAVICLDMIGDRDLAISIPSNGNAALTKLAIQAAQRAELPDLVKPIGCAVLDDHVPFLQRGYPAIDLIDFVYGPDNAYWHTPQDTMDKISEESLLKSGKIAAELLNILL